MSATVSVIVELLIFFPCFNQRARTAIVLSKYSLVLSRRNSSNTDGMTLLLVVVVVVMVIPVGVIIDVIVAVGRGTPSSRGTKNSESSVSDREWQPRNVKDFKDGKKYS